MKLLKKVKGIVVLLMLLNNFTLNCEGDNDTLVFIIKYIIVLMATVYVSYTVGTDIRKNYLDPKEETVHQQQDVQDIPPKEDSLTTPELAKSESPIKDFDFWDFWGSC